MNLYIKFFSEIFHIFIKHENNGPALAEKNELPDLSIFPVLENGISSIPPAFQNKACGFDQNAAFHPCIPQNSDNRNRLHRVLPHLQKILNGI